MNCQICGSPTYHYICETCAKKAVNYNTLITVLEDISGDAAFSGMGESLQDRIYAVLDESKNRTTKIR